MRGAWKQRVLQAVPGVVILLCVATYAAAQVAGSGGIGRLLVYLNGSQKYVDRVNFNGFTGVQDGGLLTLSGGGSASNPTGCVQGSLLSAGSDGGEGTCNGNVASVDNAGSISIPVGATIGTLDPRTAKTTLDNLPARVISSDEFKSATQDVDYCFNVNITTTNATATVFHRIAMPQASQLHVNYTCTATQFDGGAIVSARYERRLTSTLADGGSAPSTVGGIDTIGTDRENDSTWGGPSAVTYDGGSNTGIVELVLQGVAAQTIDWNCSGCWKRTPRADSGIP